MSEVFLPVRQARVLWQKRVSEQLSLTTDDVLSDAGAPPIPPDAGIAEPVIEGNGRTPARPDTAAAPGKATP